jgi:hypothetical protein
MGLGYDERQKTSEGDANTMVTKPSEKKNEEKPKSYANIFKGSINNESSNMKGMMTNGKIDSSYKN